MRYLIIDIIRIIALLMIITGHLAQFQGYFIGDFFGIQDLYYASIGGIGVTIFIILSGLSLQLRYHITRIDYIAFALKRMLRIYPVYWASTAFAAGLIAVDSCYEYGRLASSFHNAECADILLCVTGFSAFAGKWGGPFIDTAWFIGLIITLYFIYPPLSYIIKKYPHRAILALLLTSLFSRYVIGTYRLLPERPQDWFPLCRIFEFSLGIYLANAVPTDFWSRLNSLKRMGPPIALLAKMSFPLFLVHLPLLQVIFKKDINIYVAILLFITLSLAASWLIMIADDRIPREKIFKNLKAVDITGRSA